MVRQNGQPSLFTIFASFLRLGSTAFGGAAMVAYIRRMAVQQKGWLDDATFRDGVAFCQTVPGATAMQVAAYSGLRAGGVAGAAAAYVGFALPAFLIMMLLSALYMQSRQLPAIVSAFAGLQAVVVAIIANAAVSFGRDYLRQKRDLILVTAAALLFLHGFSPIIVISMASLAGLVLYADQDRKRSRSAADTPSNARPLLIILAAVSTGFGLLYLFFRDLFWLAALMFRIDLFAFGGGFASLPLMLHEFVDLRGMDSRTFLDGIALGQATPGPMVITATFVGYMQYGLAGGLVATIGIFLPSFLLVVAMVPYYDRLSASPRFNRAVNGIFCSFIGLLASTAIHFASNIPWEPIRAALAIAAFAALLFKVDILWVVLVGAIISIILL